MVNKACYKSRQISCEPHNHENRRWKSYSTERDNGRVSRGNYLNYLSLQTLPCRRVSRLSYTKGVSNPIWEEKTDNSMALVFLMLNALQI